MPDRSCFVGEVGCDCIGGLGGWVDGREGAGGTVWFQQTNINNEKS